MDAVLSSWQSTGESGDCVGPDETPDGAWVVAVEGDGRHHRERHEEADDPLTNLSVVEAGAHLSTALGILQERKPEVDPLIGQMPAARRHQRGQELVLVGGELLHGYALACRYPDKDGGFGHLIGQARTGTPRRFAAGHELAGHPGHDRID